MGSTEKLPQQTVWSNPGRFQVSTAGFPTDTRVHAPVWGGSCITHAQTREGGRNRLVFLPHNALSGHLKKNNNSSFAYTLRFLNFVFTGFLYV